MTIQRDFQWHLALQRGGLSVILIYTGNQGRRVVGLCRALQVVRIQEIVTLKPGEQIDSDWLARLLAQHARWLERVVYRTIPQSLRSEVRTDDVLQDVWMAAYRSLRTFDARSPESTAAWLATIAESKAVDAVRRARAIKRGSQHNHVVAGQADLSSFVNLFELVTCSGKTPSRDASAMEIAQIIKEGLAQLPEQLQQVIWLHYIEGIRVADVAVVIGKTKPAVHHMLRSGRAQLSERLGDAARFFTDVPDDTKSDA